MTRIRKSRPNARDWWRPVLPPCSWFMENDMLDFVFFNPGPRQRFVDFLVARGVAAIETQDDETFGVAIPDDINVVAEYPIATAAAAPNAEGAQAFVDFVMGEQGQEILESYGFIKP